MNVDYIAARQDIADLKSKAYMDKALIEEVLVIMSRLAKPGEVRRKEFDLNQFFVEFAQVDFSSYTAFDVGILLGVMGESFKSGVTVSNH